MGCATTPSLVLVDEHFTRVDVPCQRLERGVTSPVCFGYITRRRQQQHSSLCVIVADEVPGLGHIVYDTSRVDRHIVEQGPASTLAYLFVRWHLRVQDGLK